MEGAICSTRKGGIHRVCGKKYKREERGGYHRCEESEDIKGEKNIKNKGQKECEERADSLITIYGKT